MHKVFLILLISLLVCSRNGICQQVDTPAIVVYKPEYKELFKAGLILHFKQFCIADMDSQLRTGYIMHEKAKIGSVGKCDITWKVVNDTLVLSKVVSHGKRQTKELFTKMKNQFGAFSQEETVMISPVGLGTLYVWEKESFNSGWVTKHLYVGKKWKKGLVVMEYWQIK